MSVSIMLDVKFDRALSIHCSRDYSVIFTGSILVVALGPASVLSGRESLGSLSGTIVLANSYSIQVPSGLRSDREARIRVVGHDLILSTKSRIWIVDLSNPTVWRNGVSP